MSSFKRKQPPRQRNESRSKRQKQDPGESDKSAVLFFGNLSPAVTNKLLEEFVVATLLYIGVVSASSTQRSVIINCNVVRKLSSAFIEFATPEMAMDARVLNHVHFMGTQLSVETRTKSSRQRKEGSSRWDDLHVGDLPVTNTSTRDHHAEQSRDDRQLCLRNITPGMTDDLLALFLGSAMKQARLTRSAESSVTCTIQGSGLQSKRAMVEFCNREEATNALFLNRIPFMGVNLSVTRIQRSDGSSLDRNTCNWQSALERFTVPGTPDDRASRASIALRYSDARMPMEMKTGGRLDIKSQHEVFITGFDPNIKDIHLILRDYVDAMMQIVGSTTIPGIPTVIYASWRLKQYTVLLFSTPEAATDALLLDQIPFMGTHISVKRPRAYTGTDAKTIDWKTLVGRYSNRYRPDNITQFAKRCPGDNELFVSHESLEISKSTLVEFLASAAEQLGLTTSQGSPITECRLNGTWAFLVFRSPEETTNALCLDKIPLFGTRLSIARPKKWTGSRVPCSNWPEALSKLRIPFHPPPPEQSAHKPEGRELKKSEIEVGERYRDSKEMELQRLLKNTTKPQKIDGFNGETLETVNKKWGEARDQLKAQTEKFDAAHAELTHLKTQLDEMTNQNQRLDSGKISQLVVENDMLKQTITQMKEAANVESHTMAELRSRLDTTEKRNQRMGDILANSMDELISERKSRRDLEEKMESALQLEKTQREKAEKEVESLKAALTAARSRMAVPVSSGTENAARQSIKSED